MYYYTEDDDRLMAAQMAAKQNGTQNESSVAELIKKYHCTNLAAAKEMQIHSVEATISLLRNSLKLAVLNHKGFLTKKKMAELIDTIVDQKRKEIQKVL